MNVLTSSSIGSLAGSGTVNLGTHTLILTNANSTFSGTISGSGGLTIGSGTETLAGNNTYAGTTTISAGTLVLSATASIAAASAVKPTACSTYRRFPPRQSPSRRFPVWVP